MLKITETAENGNTIRLRLDGTITASSLTELNEVLARHEPTGSRTIILDMAGVTFMDDDGARKIATLRGETLYAINCSPFITTLLDTVEKAD